MACIIKLLINNYKKYPPTHWWIFTNNKTDFYTLNLLKLDNML